jgi:hypothetical protein
MQGIGDNRSNEDFKGMISLTSYELEGIFVTFITFHKSCQNCTTRLKAEHKKCGLKNHVLQICRSCLAMERMQ